VGDWRKSTYSDATGGQCVEVASADGVKIRDTANRDRVTLSVSTSAWTAFLAKIVCA
jgi:hypothetical protein